MEIGNKVLEKILLKIKYKNAMISISHSNYKVALGGTEKGMCVEQEILAQYGISYIHFFPKTNGINGPIDEHHQYMGMNVDGEFIDYLNTNQLRPILYVLKRMNVKVLGIYIHHTMGINMETLEKLVDNVSDNIKFFLHDYYSACPQFNLLKNYQIYCGNMPESKCLDCIYGEERKKFLNKFGYFFHKYNITFIAPSESAKQIWVQTYKDYSYKVRVVPHQVLKGTYRKSEMFQGKIKLAYIGNGTAFYKGGDMWRFITKNIDTDKYELYHFGRDLEKVDNVKNIKVSFQDDGQDAMIKMLRKYNIDIVLMWAMWPETYSYAYFESYASGAFIITNNISGNISAQVKKNQNGIILENKESVYSFLSDKDNVSKLLKKNAKMEFPLALEANTELSDEIKSLACGKKEKFSFNKHDLINILNEI